MRVKNMESRNGNPMPNQFIVTDKKGTWFQSYNSMIAFRAWLTGKITLDTNFWDYSTTTGKYRNIFNTFIKV